MPPAARITDKTVHPLPPSGLAPGPGCLTVLIGGLPAWRGINPAALGPLMAVKTSTDAAVAAATGPALPVAQAAQLTAMTTAISAAASMGGVDIHACLTPAPPHGPGIVIKPSMTVMIGNLGAARMGDDILEALSPVPNKILMGCPTVIIGG